ncbi:MAG TPA: hypothetical protein VKB71_10280 [Rhizomicrobium sp.]|jgi:hypothetical protein|nr:hypothetical protein [Rhizomicrobium sp.]
MSKPPPPDARSKAESAFSASQQRDESIKQEIAKEQARVDAKTAKLRALRLAKEAADREAGLASPPEAAPKRTRKKKSPA